MGTAFLTAPADTHQFRCSGMALTGALVHHPSRGTLCACPCTGWLMCGVGCGHSSGAAGDPHPSIRSRLHQLRNFFGIMRNLGSGVTALGTLQLRGEVRMLLQGIRTRTTLLHQVPNALWRNHCPAHQPLALFHRGTCFHLEID